MSTKQRKIPIEVSIWMEKDVKVRKVKASSRLMPNNTRQNVVLSRQFYSNMFNLSSERHRKIIRYEFNKQNFLKNQRIKAETTMPGLLPYVEQLTNDMNQSSSSRSTSNGNDQLISPSFQSFTTRSMIKSESTFYHRQQSVKKSETLESIPTKPSDRQQKLLERINRLAQPKGHHLNSTTNNHVRSHMIGTITVQDLFGNMDEMSHDNSLLPDKSKNVTHDKRFRQLIHLFSEIHEREPTHLQTVQNIIKSNPSLQDNEEQKQMKKIPTCHANRLKKHQQILADQFSRKSNMCLIDIGA